MAKCERCNKESHCSKDANDAGCVNCNCTNNRSVWYVKSSSNEEARTYENEG
ncbi:MAG: hypothetical protein H8E55_18700, partial [Pelagibacterales bacterium]|nr:hypothetical protein [Pelagibacterales bacterium]